MLKESRSKVYKVLTDLGIVFEVFEHPPLDTIEIAQEYWKDIDAIQSGDCELCDLFFPNLFWCEHPAPEVCDALLNAEALHIYVAHILTDSALDYERRFIAESVHNAKNFPSMTAVLELIELAKQGI
jgi:hypothetical protein